MAVVSMKALLETGVHFGHRTRKWNPKMRPFIFTERNGIHILDLQQTIKALGEVYEIVRDVVIDGDGVLFVGTKRQAQETIAREAERCAMPYVNQRWLGGTLTNWVTIRQRIDYLDDLEERQARGELDLLSKRENLMITRKMEKLRNRLGGIRKMTRLPGMLFVVDVVREATAVREANILNIPIIAMVDTNGNPDLIDYVIPSNDDAIRAIKLITGIMAEAALEGLGLRKDITEEEEAAREVYEHDLSDYEDDGEVDDETYLGEATLAKLRSGSLDFDDGEEIKDKSDDVEEKDESDDGADGDAKDEGESDDEADDDAKDEGESDDEADGDAEEEGESDDEADDDAEDEGESDDEADDDAEEEGESDDEVDDDAEEEDESDDEADDDAKEEDEANQGDR